MMKLLNHQSTSPIKQNIISKGYSSNNKQHTTSLSLLIKSHAPHQEKKLSQNSFPQKQVKIPLGITFIKVINTKTAEGNEGEKGMNHVHQTSSHPHTIIQSITKTNHTNPLIVLQTIRSHSHLLSNNHPSNLSQVNILSPTIQIHHLCPSRIQSLEPS